MSLTEQTKRFFRVPKLTFARLSLAMAVAVLVDSIQLFSGGLGWLGFDQALDVIAMVVIARLIGFHILLLPTFAIDLVPVLDEFPTWIACVIAVGLIRKREQRAQKQAQAQKEGEPPDSTIGSGEPKRKQTGDKPASD